MPVPRGDQLPHQVLDRQEAHAHPGLSQPHHLAPHLARVRHHPFDHEAAVSFEDLDPQARPGGNGLRVPMNMPVREMLVVYPG